MANLPGICNGRKGARFNDAVRELGRKPAKAGSAA
jgi:hypothetical protein